MTGVRVWFRRHGHLVVFLAPGLLLYGLFMAYPLLTSLSYSLSDWHGLVRGGFAGLANFAKVLTQWPYNARFWGALSHNALFFLLTFAIQSTLGLLLASLLSRKWRGFAIFQAAYFLPYTLSMVVVGFLWLLLLNPTWGAVAHGLRLVGLEAWVQPWLGQRSTALITVILVNAWHWLGFPVLVFMAAIQGIPRKYHEAGLVDGANEWQGCRHITLPLLLPSLLQRPRAGVRDAGRLGLAQLRHRSAGHLLLPHRLRRPHHRGEPGQIGLASAIGVLMLIIIGAASAFGVRFSQQSQTEY
ncbi:MAG: sugar ABC transporter permease [Deinococcales bacterium]